MGIVTMSDFFIRFIDFEEQKMFLEICKRMNSVEKQVKVEQFRENLFHVQGTEKDAGAAAILYRMFHKHLVNFQVA